METIIVLGILAVVFVFLLAKTAQSLVHISGPNEVLVFSGLRNSSSSGTRGYKVIKGGKGFRVPLFEVVDRMDLTNMVIDVSVSGAYSKGGIPLNVQAVANVKIAGDEPLIHNALERLLNVPREQLIKIARETLEGNLRGVLATLTPEQVNEDKMAFAQSLLAEAEHDLSALGLSLDTLKIQNVTDDQGYLAAIGRRQSAELLKRARSAEALARAEAAVTEAKNREETVLAQIDARMQVARAEANRRIVDAKTQRGARRAEEQAEVTSQVARATADMDVQKARIEQIRRKLQAEVITPAIARRDALIQEARGDAAQVIEDGRARAEALGDITEVWLSYGESAKRALVMQKLEPIAELLTSTIDHLNVDNITFIGSGSQGSGEEPFSMKALRTMEEFRHASGVDVAGIARRFSGGDEAVGEDAPAPQAAAAKPAKGQGAAHSRAQLPDEASSVASVQMRTSAGRRGSASSDDANLGRSLESLTASRRQRSAERQSEFRARGASRPATAAERSADAFRSAVDEEGTPQEGWYATTPDRRVGPVDLDALREQIRDGELSGEVYIWRKGMSDWEPLTKTPVWTDALASAGVVRPR